MPTAQRQRQKRELKRQDRRAIKLHSTALSVGHSAPLPSPPDFGAPKFSEAKQAANPNKPMTRRIKDFLRVGEWKEGFDAAGNPVFGKYDAAELQIILNNAIGLMANGDPINLGKSHGDDQMIIPTDELISPVDQVKLHNGVLWFSTYVTPAQAEYLDNPAIKVSAGMFPDYTAGNGKKFQGRTLLHIAATDRPVVGGQGPFIALSNYIAVAEVKPAAAEADQVVNPPVPVQAKPTIQPAAKGVPKASQLVWAHEELRTPKVKRSAGLSRVRQRIANIRGRKLIRFGNDVLPRAIALASTIQGSANMDIAALISAINALLKAMGIGLLPDGTDETNIIPRLEGVAMALGGEVTPEDPAEPANPNDPASPADPMAAAAGGAPAMMANLLRQVDSRITQANKPLLAAIAGLTTAVQAKAGEVVLDAKGKYIAFRNALGKAGVLESVLTAKDKIAEKVGWDTEVLEGIIPTIKMSNVISAAGATIEPAKDPIPNGVLTPEQLEARVKARGGNVANIPKS